MWPHPLVTGPLCVGGGRGSVGISGSPPSGGEVIAWSFLSIHPSLLSLSPYLPLYTQSDSQWRDAGSLSPSGRSHTGTHSLRLHHPSPSHPSPLTPSLFPRHPLTEDLRTLCQQWNQSNQFDGLSPKFSISNHQTASFPVFLLSHEDCQNIEEVSRTVSATRNTEVHIISFVCICLCVHV